MYYVKRPDHITWNSDFTFCRLAFRQAYDGDGGGWGVDYPRADMNLPIRLSELTKTPVNFDQDREPNHVVIQANEPELFKCPFVMITEVGATHFEQDEALALRSYLQKGGFMWADDFWGERAWHHWERELRKVLPGERISDRRPEDGSFDLPHAVRRQAVSADSVDRLGEQRDHLRSATTARHLMHARQSIRTGASWCSFRTTRDFGDSYERESDDPTYFYNFSVEGYAIGINVLLYAMTH